ncbi:15641_t:CDS:2 [Dentiscutata erythropus]|uniref:15641_t:CDS:1 n=1 Tax=Dentiscutata erythropus TaxID=1348616 RepID=A0A9N9NWU8_9GLOM|nr:15641_t:CDS:2 [Dentiscutata erythropus]
MAETKIKQLGEEERNQNKTAWGRREKPIKLALGTHDLCEN